MDRPDWAAAPASAPDWAKQPTAAAKPKEPPEDPTSAGNLVGAAVEPLLAMGTGAAGQVAGGIGGIGAMVNKGLGFSDRDPADVVRSVSKGMTYEPRTTGGKNAMKAIGYPFEKIGEFSSEAGGKTADMLTRAGLPKEAGAEVGALGSAAMQFLPQLLGGRGAAAAMEKPGIMKPAGPPTNPAMAELAKRDVTMTPGQLLGGGVNKFEQAIGKWPIVGAPIRGARSRGVEEFNRGAIQDSLDPIGEKLPPGLKGNDAIAHAYGKLGDAYDGLLPNLVGRLDGKPAPMGSPPALPPPGGATPKVPTLREELTDLRKNMDSTKMPKKLKDEFGRILDDEIINRFQKGGVTSGETIKTIESSLGSLAKTKMRSENYDVRQQGMALAEAQAAIRRMVNRENPEYQGELAKINEGYAKFKIAQEAASGVGADKGTFTPSQYHRAVRASDPTKDKRAFSEGKANQQPLSAAGKELLADTLPDSGTPYQAFVAMLAHSASGKAGVLGLPGGMAAAAALALPYSKMGTSAMQRMIMNPPKFGPPAARALPYGAAASSEQE